MFERRTTFIILILMLISAAPACAQEKGAEKPVFSADCKNPFAGIKKPAFSVEGWNTNFCKHSVPYDEIISGGPPRDGIPPIDNPRFELVSAADRWLKDDEPVIALALGEDARAYPLQILIWHEIANDRVNGIPVAATFCPLCYAAIVFERPEIDGHVLTFGTSGNLRHSDLVMWDRQTESWWQQFSGEAIVGDLTGKRLKALPAQIVSWDDFKKQYPSGQVLSRDTGFDRRYGENPYVGYDDVSQRPFLYSGPVGDRLPPMARVVGVVLEELGRAYPLTVLKERRVVNDTLGDTPIAMFWAEGTASAVDERTISGSRDIGGTGVFLRRTGDRTLTFDAKGDGKFTDRETGSTWNLFGEAVGGPLLGSKLEPLVHHNIFWFVWSAFQPKGTLYDP